MAQDHTEDESVARNAAQFATTHWSVVLAAGDSAAPGSQEALENLCRTYWLPLYAFVRRKGHSPEDAKDLTQEFFLRLIGKRRLDKADPERGRFRTFLLATLKHFLCDEWDRRRTARRGGGVPVVSLDAGMAEERLQTELSTELTPDQVFDRDWAAVLLESVLTTLRDEAQGAGKGELFDALSPCLMGDRMSDGYAAVGRQFGLSEAAVKMAVSRLRHRFRHLLQLEIERTVTTKKEAQEEFQHLGAALRQAR